MDVRLADRYRFWMWLLLPLTLGLGTVILWAWALRWPRQLTTRGIRLRGGQFVDWSDIKRLGVTEGQFDHETIQLDLYFNGGVARVPVRYLDNGEQAAAAIRASVRNRMKAEP
jgi:hypothetical protein